MNLTSVKIKLIQNHIPTWKLIKAMNISHNTYYSYARKGFKGMESKVTEALNNLVRGRKYNE